MRPSTQRLLFAALAFAAGVGACSSSLSGFVGVPAHDVFVTPGAPQHGTGGDTVYYSIANNGASPAYLMPCGDAPAISYEVFQNGAWVNTGPAISCAVQTVPGPIELDPGTPIVVSTVYASPGRYRAGVSAASKADLSDAAMAWSVAVDIP
jgi:hypothetical protein